MLDAKWTIQKTWRRLQDIKGRILVAQGRKLEVGKNISGTEKNTSCSGKHKSGKGKNVSGTWKNKSGIGKNFLPEGRIFRD